MANIERLTITLPADMAALVKGAVAGGDYASTSEVVRRLYAIGRSRRKSVSRNSKPYGATLAKD